ncbi:DUF6968 family protein [Bosea sp. 685]|uniref:DUF6968 family protein n=1 Tax=Bosea sp. 685 TaxID=3080057 RepID=UPI0028936927|nr:hypothetical protein [Bosea sp. 685]WNJ90828.1 hypothetical protein RMR04_31485 [Bosea sp. 685]
MDAPAAIAKRTFELSQSGRVEVSFFAPMADGNDWRCEYRIEWPDRTRSHRAFGVDSVQALLLAMKNVQAELTNAPETLAEGLTWLGNVDLDLPSVRPAEDSQS